MMDYRAFILEIQDRAGLNTERESVIAVEATLKTLGERLSEREAVYLAAQLPPEIGRFLTVVDTNQIFDLEEFYENVARRELTDSAESREHARVVISLVEETVGPGALQEALARLPEDYAGLFSPGSLLAG